MTEDDIKNHFGSVLKTYMGFEIYSTSSGDIYVSEIDGESTEIKFIFSNNADKLSMKKKFQIVESAMMEYFEILKNK